MIKTISNTSSLATRLRERIKREGPITFCEWMKAALYDPDDGYYCRVDRIRWGREGDYRTSPERSSLFSATFARYFATVYDELGRPSTWTIVEAGAGEGHFAAGLLETLRKSFTNVFEATSFVIDEVSSQSRARARQRLQPFADRVQFSKLDDVDINPSLVFSNELLDAFPVHRVTQHDGKLKEFYVTTVGENGNFEWMLADPGPALSPRLEEYFEKFGISEGQIVEFSLEIERWLRRVAARMETGHLITVDYGTTAADLYSRPLNRNGTLRGFQRHRFVDDLLAQPGEHDLTTTLNWSFVKSVGERLGFEVVQFERLDRFLLAAGLLEQLEVESLHCQAEADRLRLRSAAREMILPDGMAGHFQVLVQKKSS
jgi:SAM-dependent MidA family methyltransferase